MAKFELPPLPYDYAALEPHIDAQTMQIHHDKHHQTYVDKLNAALEGMDVPHESVDDLMRSFGHVPDASKTAVQNHGGGHSNHSMFWTIMAPGAGGPPSGEVAAALDETFGGFDAFKEKFNTAATNLFGSGWAWLVYTGGKLDIIARPNQNTPLAEGIETVMGLDVWEHAYYLKYQNKRPDYIAAWWNVVNWDEVNKRLEAAKSR